MGTGVDKLTLPRCEAEAECSGTCREIRVRARAGLTRIVTPATVLSVTFWSILERWTWNLL